MQKDVSVQRRFWWQTILQKAQIFLFPPLLFIKSCDSDRPSFYFLCRRQDLCVDYMRLQSSIWLLRIRFCWLGCFTNFCSRWNDLLFNCSPTTLSMHCFYFDFSICLWFLDFAVADFAALETVFYFWSEVKVAPIFLAYRQGRLQ